LIIETERYYSYLEFTDNIVDENNYFVKKLRNYSIFIIPFLSNNFTISKDTIIGIDKILNGWIINTFDEKRKELIGYLIRYLIMYHLPSIGIHLGYYALDQNLLNILYPLITSLFLPLFMNHKNSLQINEILLFWDFLFSENTSSGVFSTLFIILGILDTYFKEVNLISITSQSNLEELINNISIKVDLFSILTFAKSFQAKTPSSFL
jgi:hypothetical protein